MAVGFLDHPLGRGGKTEQYPRWYLLSDSKISFFFFGFFRKKKTAGTDPK
jgi:hypothetical protein